MTMTAEMLETQVLDLVAATASLDRALLSPELTVEELGLDSLDVLRLTYAIEKHFRISLTAYSHTDVTSLTRLIEILHHELASRPTGNV
jgi:acyl carrier protein